MRTREIMGFERRNGARTINCYAVGCPHNHCWAIWEWQVQTAIKAVLFLALGPVVLPLVYFYFTSLPLVAIWLWVWLLCFGWTLHSTWKTDSKGMFFLFSSVTLSVLGEHFFKGPEFATDILSVKVLSQIMLVMGAGLGANLISHWMLNEKK